MLGQISNIEQYNKLKNEKDFFILLFYTDSSEKSKEAFKRLEQVKKEYNETPIYAVNASNVKDIHPLLGVNSVPTVLALKHGNVAKNIQGLQTKDHYEMLLWDAPPKPSNGKEEEKRHRVVVYTTPSCPWCNRLKSHLRKNRVMFQEVDVSRDQHAAEELMRRSGQTGVPQSDIDGEMIVGFDQARIDRLLGLSKL